jgi:hypothetical protein
MFDWSIYKQFLLNTSWKPDFLQIMIFVYVCSTCSVFELKTRFDTWIARNEVIGVYWFHLSYLITVWRCALHLPVPIIGANSPN